MTRHSTSRDIARLGLALALSVAGAACSSGNDDSIAIAIAPSTTAPPPSTSTTVAASTTIVATTTTAPPTTVVMTTTAAAPGRELVFSMSDGEQTFTLTTDEIDRTARFVVERNDGSPTPRWETVVPWMDEPNSSGHRPYDGLPTTPVTGGDRAQANLALVEEYITTALVEGRWEDVDRFFRNGEYVLHGPLFADGLESVRTFFVGLRDAGAPFVITGTSLWLAAGDFVLAINRHDAADGATTAYWDLWRVSDGAIAEHWDAIAPVPTEITDAWFAGSGPAV